MTLESYLKYGEGIGITRFYVETIEYDGEISFYIHPVDDPIRIGGEPIHYAVLGNLLEPIEVDTIRDGKQQIDAFRSELEQYISLLGLTFHPAEEPDDDILALLQKTRQVLAAFALNKKTADQQAPQAEKKLKHLKTELLRHEAIIGIQREDDGDFNAFANRIEY
ncbi:hypothetical protein, partial [Argonema galeatum]|uniref:hypothetical protein n=1 Tax=Argonema galeatum TaxID=2942762 RepID=UPI00201373F3